MLGIVSEYIAWGGVGNEMRMECRGSGAEICN
jgi:hypothetical protein